MLFYNLLCLLFMIATISELNGAKILIIPAHNIASHTKSMYPFAEKVASRNHDVYMLQLLRGDHEKTKSKKIKDIYIEYPTSPKDMPAIEGQIMWTPKATDPIGYVFPWMAGSFLCRDILNHTKFSEQLFSVIKDKSWDLVIVDNLFAPCGILATEVNNAPSIEFSTSFTLASTANALGVQWLPAYMPQIRPAGKFDPSSFYDRFWNTYDSYVYLAIGSLFKYLLPKWTENEATSNLSYQKFLTRSVIVYGSMPYELDFPHPKAVNVIEMDGSCPKSEDLPEHYQKFVDDRESKGTILFAMGHFGDWHYAPPHALQAFIDAFNELKDYRIIWQFKNKGENPKVGKQIMLDAWIPQAGILYHNKTVLFISHMGFKSIRESICAHVPVVSLPMFAEQQRNAAIAKQRGFGEYLNKLTITKEYVLETMKKVLNDPSYKTNVAKMDEFLTDRIEDPVNLGAFWLDFVIKHKPYAEGYLKLKVPLTTFCEYGPVLAIFVFVFGFMKSIV